MNWATARNPLPLLGGSYFFGFKGNREKGTMDEFDYLHLPLSSGGRERLKEMLSKREERFRQRITGAPGEIGEIILDELVRGSIRDYFVCLLDVPASSDARAELLRTYAANLGNDEPILAFGGLADKTDVLSLYAFHCERVNVEGICIGILRSTEPVQAEGSIVPAPATPTTECDDADETTHGSGSAIAIERAKLMQSFKDRCREAGFNISDTMIAKAARPTWNHRTPVARWKSNDRRATQGDDVAIRRVLTQTPHLIAGKFGIAVPHSKKTSS